MKKTLLLMRHAKSSWSQPGLKDFDRPLKRRGQKAARKMARHLVSIDSVPEVILCSTAERTRETVAMMLPLFPTQPTVLERDELYHALPEKIVATIREVDEDVSTVMVVGHNPGLEELIFDWTAEFIPFSTAAIARFFLDEIPWREVSVRASRKLDDIWFPRELPDDDDDTETSA